LIPEDQSASSAKDEVLDCANRNEDLYAKYGLTATEIAFVEKLVRPMNLDSGDDE